MLLGVYIIFVITILFFYVFSPPKNAHGSGERLKSFESSELLSYKVYHSTEFKHSIGLFYNWCI